MKARSTCNPFEKIGRSVFQNRALFDQMFTQPTTNVSFFADVCAGPGGFSEYILWRTKDQIKGFGFTLRGKNDFELKVSSNIFERCYGCRNNGNILAPGPENILSLKTHIIKATHGNRVDFMMANGGFDIHHENMQEIVSKQLYLL